MKRYLKYIFTRTKALKVYTSLDGKIKKEKNRKILAIFLMPIGFLANILDIFLNNKHNFKYNLSIVLIAKNEAPYLNEWVKYHHLIGCQKFFIFDNDSTDDTKEVLKKYINTGLVEYHKIHGEARQMDAYNIALRKAKKESKFLAIIDADEFIFVLNPKDNLLNIIDDLFSSSDSIGGIGINWMIFGSSNYIKKPKGLVTQKYISRSKYSFSRNQHIKTICDPRKVQGILNPHYVEYKRKYYEVNMLGVKITGAMTKPSGQMPVRINHYFTKSKEEFMKKRNRGMADQKGIRNISDFELHDRNEIIDNSMSRYFHELNKDL